MDVSVREVNEVSENVSVSVSDWVNVLPIGIEMKELETQFILQTLKHHNGNRTHAAKTLGISLRTLRNRINEFTSKGFSVAPPAMKRTS